ncbi:PREDICTED: target of Nesh-SH3 isoform X7 [Bison bison bison]|uniref:Target of Nesh-SH3 isoform X7 n=1 Tax=Bison bison bison TaxID=43346 RepID=A0A6P3HLE1_BISBB|nr:PREDICTED: target of Nesh-SH3 isoform X7 [Bison bison bison]
MLSSLGCLLLCGSIALALGNAQKLPKGKRPNLKVHINTTSDSIFLKFLRPSPNVKLEGFLLGYGSNLSPNQYFPLPAEGKYTEAIVDAEPKYLIVVRPAPPPSQKKSCSGKKRARKPLQLVVGTLSPSSVFLSWGFLINPHHDWTLPSQCPNDRYYTIRYREKDKEKKWIFQLCPATETIVENLKPDTVYEFGVKDNVEGGIWSKIFNHKTIVGSKSKVNGKIQSTYDQVHSVPAYVPRKLIPVTIIKQVIQNVTHRASTKSPDKTPYGGTILVHLVIPGLNETTVKLPTSIMFEISEAIKTQLAKNETLALPAESKTPEVEKIPALPITVTPESVPRTTKPTVSSALDISETTLVLRGRTPGTSQTILIPRFELPLSTLALKRLPEFPQAKTPFPFEKPGGALASSEKPGIVPTSKISEDSKILLPQTATYDVFSSPTTSDEPEISEPHTATSDLLLDSVPPKTSRTLEQPRATLAPKTSKRTRRPRPKLKTTTTPEAPQTKPVPTTDLEPGTLRTEAPEIVVLPTIIEPVTHTTKAPETTLAYKTTRVRRPRPRPKTTSSPEAPQTKLALTELQTLILKPVTSPSLEMTQSQPVSEVLESLTFSTESSKEAIAPTEIDYVYSTAKAPLRPEEPETEVVGSITHVSEPPETTLASKQIPRTPPKPKTSPHPRIPQTQSAPKVFQRVTLKPKTSPSPEVSYTPPVPRDVLLPHKPDPEVSQSEPVLQPVTFRIHLPETTLAPLETRGSPLIPMISPSTSQEELQTTLAATDQSTQELFTTKVPQTTELAKTTQAPHRLYTTTMRPRTPDKPHIRPVLNKTTTRPSRPRPSGTPRGNGLGAGVKQVPLPSGTGRNVSMDSSHPTKKPAIIPGTRRPPLPPRPMPPRRKPLPPNNVTGKPGSAGIISSDRVTSPPLRATLIPTEAPLERMETDKKQPTAPASGEDLDNITDFSSSPTRETDPLGKPRFKGPHVRYIQKPDNSPCSITDSVKRFPKEEATEGNATSPPQNPPTNLTVVTVEGCPSFVILDWDKPLNDTVTEYEVISRENGSFSGKNKSIQTTNQTFSTVENLKPDTSYEFQVKPINPLGEGPPSNTVAFSTESADPRVSEPVSAGRDAIWTERPFNSDSYSECKGKQYVKRTWYKKFVGVQLCNSLRYKIYLSDSLTGKFYNIGDQRGHGEDHCQFVDSFLDGRTGQQLSSDQLPTKEGYFRAVRQEPVQFGEIGGHTQINYVQWYECGTTIPGKW